MAYIETPPSARVFQRGTLAARYLATAAVGILATRVHDHGSTLPLMGWGIALFSLVALVGVLAHYYRAEWVALGPLIGALLSAAVVVHDSATLIVTACVVALALAQVDRLQHLTLVASRLRRMPPKPKE